MSCFFQNSRVATLQDAAPSVTFFETKCENGLGTAGSRQVHLVLPRIFSSPTYSPSLQPTCADRAWNLRSGRIPASWKSGTFHQTLGSSVSPWPGASTCTPSPEPGGEGCSGAPAVGIRSQAPQTAGPLHILLCLPAGSPSNPKGWVLLHRHARSVAKILPSLPGPDANRSAVGIVQNGN